MCSLVSKRGQLFFLPFFLVVRCLHNPLTEIVCVLPSFFLSLSCSAPISIHGFFFFLSSLQVETTKEKVISLELSAPNSPENEAATPEPAAAMPATAAPVLAAVQDDDEEEEETSEDKAATTTEEDASMATDKGDLASGSQKEEDNPALLEDVTRGSASNTSSSSSSSSSPSSSDAEHE